MGVTENNSVTPIRYTLLMNNGKENPMKKEINIFDYLGFWSDYDFLTYGEWSDSVRAEWAKYGEQWEIKPSEWEDYLEAQWEKRTAELG